jgi:hypothetical protein
MQSHILSFSRRHLLDEPDSGISGETSAEERIALVALLTAEAWSLAGLKQPAYARSDIPIARRPLRTPRGHQHE